MLQTRDFGNRRIHTITFEGESYSLKTSVGKIKMESKILNAIMSLESVDFVDYSSIEKINLKEIEKIMIEGRVIFKNGDAYNFNSEQFAIIKSAYIQKWNGKPNYVLVTGVDEYKWIALEEVLQFKFYDDYLKVSYLSGGSEFYHLQNIEEFLIPPEKFEKVNNSSYFNSTHYDSKFTQELIHLFRCQLNNNRDVNIFTSSNEELYEDQILRVSDKSIKRIISSSEIIRCEAEGSYTSIYFKDGSKILYSKNLGEVENLLPIQNFFRIHRKHLINCKEVAKMTKELVIMKDKKVIQIARRKKNQFIEHIESQYIVIGS